MKNKIFFTGILLISLSSCELISIDGSSFSSNIDSSKTSQDSSNVDNGSSDSQSTVISSTTTTTSSTESDSSTSSATDEPETDPYINVDVDEFYRKYKPATSLKDSTYRSKHHLLSGKLETCNYMPTLSSTRPIENGKYVLNTKSIYKDSNNSYEIHKSDGSYVSTIFKGGAYITLDEVASYLLAFGDVPSNYTSKKSAKDLTSDEESWGEYLRLNNSYFSGDTTKYPYEPELPDLTKKQYYEIDFGSTVEFKGEDKKTNAKYNSNLTIIRGPLRLIYTRYYKSGSVISSINDRNVFYTYNHYNDFQQYLNYYGGWGFRFGQVSGGGIINDTKNAMPSSYPTVIRKPLF